MASLSCVRGNGLLAKKAQRSNASRRSVVVRASDEPVKIGINGKSSSEAGRGIP
jgi:hypothetical protein